MIVIRFQSRLAVAACVWIWIQRVRRAISHHTNLSPSVIRTLLVFSWMKGVKPVAASLKLTAWSCLVAKCGCGLLGCRRKRAKLLGPSYTAFGCLTVIPVISNWLFIVATDCVVNLTGVFSLESLPLLTDTVVTSVKHLLLIIYYPLY